MKITSDNRSSTFTKWKGICDEIGNKSMKHTSYLLSLALFYNPTPITETLKYRSHPS